MTAHKLNLAVNAYIGSARKWQPELEKFRAIVLDSGLTEEMKWGVPCYSVDGSNIVLLHTFKDYCAMLFFKGALLKDPIGILVQQTENVQAARQVRVTSAAQIDEMESILKDYLREAIAIDKAGLKVPFKPTTEFAMPEEFKRQLDASPALKKAFEALTPGRQRGYLLHFSSAKQAKTRAARVEKCMPHILDGKGLDDA